MLPITISNENIHNNDNKKSEPRPYFKGVFHLIATLFNIIMLPYLIPKIPKELIVPIGFYVFSIIGHYLSSTILHIKKWDDDILPSIRKIDHIFILIKIGATYIASIVTVMPNINMAVKAVLVLGTIVGIYMRIYYTNVHNGLIALPPIIVGWSILLDPYLVFTSFRRIPSGSTVALAGGISFTIGALIYVLKWPNPAPKYIGFHEIFHLFTIIGTGLFTFFVFEHAIPYYLFIQRLK
jgi:hemolysin III